MIVAKAANMELVVFVKTCDNGAWYEKGDNSACQWWEDSDYFLCLPQHKEACLHWLNGGKAETDRSFDEFVLVDEASDRYFKWWPEGWFMREDYKSRIKPKKEKRWIATFPWNGNDSYVTPKHFRCKESLNCYIVNNYGARDYYQAIEIEVEV